MNWPLELGILNFVWKWKWFAYTGVWVWQVRDGEGLWKNPDWILLASCLGPLLLETRTLPPHHQIKSIYVTWSIIAIIYMNSSFRLLSILWHIWLFLPGPQWAFILSIYIRECGTANAYCVYSYCWFGLSEIWTHLPKTKGTLHHHSWPWTCLWCS
jgi:hypothetical protein